MRDLSPTQELDRIRRECAQDRTDIQRLWKIGRIKEETSQQPPWDLGGSNCKWCTMPSELKLTVTKIYGPWIISPWELMTGLGVITMGPGQTATNKPERYIWSTPCLGPITGNTRFIVQVVCLPGVSFGGSLIIPTETYLAGGACPPGDQETGTTMVTETGSIYLLTESGPQSGNAFECSPLYIRFDIFRDTGFSFQKYRYRFEITE